MENDLIKSFSDSLDSIEKGALTDAFADLADAGISQLVNTPAVSGIPIVGVLVSFCRAGTAIYERHLLKQTLHFLQAFNSRTIKPKKLTKYRERLERNPEFAVDELGRVLLLLQRATDNSKATIYGNLFICYINEAISWDIFCELSDCTDRLFVGDLPILQYGYEHEGIMLFDFSNYRLDRLIALGLLENKYRIGGNIVLNMYGGNASGEHDAPKQKDVVLTPLGIDFCKYGRNFNKSSISRRASERES